jgi:ACR3 family arsenite transporter
MIRARFRWRAPRSRIRDRQPDQSAHHRIQANDHSMMMKVDFTAIQTVGKKPKGVHFTLFVNWMVQPLSMALISWLFPPRLFPVDFAAEASQYIAGTIILAAAPCTAMVFVGSYLTDQDPAYSLVQVSLNDLIMLY